MRVAVVGAAGRMGHVVASAVVAAEDMELGPLVDVAGGESIATDVSAALTADVVVDFTHPGAVAANLPIYRSGDVDVVVGTSGFDEARLTDTATLWEGASSTCTTEAWPFWRAKDRAVSPSTSFRSASAP